MIARDGGRDGSIRLLASIVRQEFQEQLMRFGEQLLTPLECFASAHTTTSALDQLVTTLVA